MRKIILLTILTNICFISCNQVSLRNQKYLTLNFNELPAKIKDTIRFALIENQDTSIRRNLRFITFQNKEEIKIIHDNKSGYGFRGVLPTKFQYKNHEFIIDFSNKEGSNPFILYGNKFYFKSSMNIWNEKMLQEETFKVINLEKYFKNK